MSDSWTGGFIRLTSVRLDGMDYIVWVRAASIFKLMVTPADIRSTKTSAVEHTMITIVTCGYQGTGSEIWVRESPDIILALVDTVLTKGGMSITSER